MSVSESSATLGAISAIRLAYDQLGSNISRVLQTPYSDPRSLQEQLGLADSLYTTVLQREQIFPPAEFSIIRTSLEAMMDALYESIQAIQPEQTQTLGPTSQIVHTGLQGRPRKQVNTDMLAVALEHRGFTDLVDLFDCSTRHLRRTALCEGLAEPCPPVYTQHSDEQTGEHVLQYNSSAVTVPEPATEELDQIITQLFNIYPNFGIRMTEGYLRSLGLQLPRARIIASIERVRGLPCHFTNAPIQRRVYSVPGPNALWHHDGQHGLIKWRIVIHAFIDGFSRLLLAIQASNNNRGSTVLKLFQDAVEVHGWPSRCRGDHGVENTEVATAIELHNGPNRGSYIFGRSVHNTRIERLWVDITRGVGKKWKDFFLELEENHLLDSDNDAHIWLLHFLFLDAINEDLLEWGEVWNNHKLRMDGQRRRSPRDMFVFGVLEIGLPVIGEEEDEVDLSTYGVDWEALEEDSLLQHHNLHNPAENGEHQEQENGNPFQLGHLQHHRMSLVEVPGFLCPLNEEQLTVFGDAVRTIPGFHSRYMEDRRTLWITALTICLSFE